MKNSLSRTLALLTFFMVCSLYAHAQQYYAVVGAFRNESNAIKFTGFVKSRFFQATYELHPTRKLFYVYALKSANKKEVLDQVKNLQADKLFSDAWFFKGQLGAEQPPLATEPVTPEPPDPVIVTLTETQLVTPDSTRVDADTTIIAEEPTVTETTPAQPLKAKGRFFKFVITDPSGLPIDGMVHHVDLKVGRDLASYKSNEYSDVPTPADRKDPMAVVCGIFGYKEITQFVDYNNPSFTEGATVDENGVWAIPFALERLKKGDLTVMYDVSFYKDAVIMLPQSQQELDELLNMMNHNPNYEIKIHGHCNGKQKRKIIMLGKNRNYFDIQGSEDKNGTAKELSKLRAEAVRDYLTEHGVAKKRMEIMEWGATNMLVKENSPGARLNDRIEIEILKD